MGGDWGRMVSRTPWIRFLGFLPLQKWERKKNLMRKRHIMQTCKTIHNGFLLFFFFYSFMSICRLTLMKKHRQKKMVLKKGRWKKRNAIHLIVDSSPIYIVILLYGRIYRENTWFFLFKEPRLKKKETSQYLNKLYCEQLKHRNMKRGEHRRSFQFWQ